MKRPVVVQTIVIALHSNMEVKLLLQHDLTNKLDELCSALQLVKPAEAPTSPTRPTNSETPRSLSPILSPS